MQLKKQKDETPIDDVPERLLSEWEQFDGFLRGVESDSIFVRVVLNDGRADVCLSYPKDSTEGKALQTLEDAESGTRVRLLKTDCTLLVKCLSGDGDDA